MSLGDGRVANQGMCEYEWIWMNGSGYLGGFIGSEERCFMLCLDSMVREGREESCQIDIL